MPRLKRTQIRFTRTQTGPDKFKTHIKFERTADYQKSKPGILHKAVSLKDRFVGDVPSLHKKLKTILPTSKKGKVALSAVNVTEKLVRNSTKLGIKAGLVAETAAFKVTNKTSRFLFRKAKLSAESKFQHLKYDNDLLRGVITAGSIFKESGKHLITFGRNHKSLITLKTDHLHKQQSALYTKEKNKKLLRSQKNTFKQQRTDFKKRKIAFKSSNKTNMERLLIKKRKQMYKSQKADYKSLKKSKTSANKKIKKELIQHKKVVKNQRKVNHEPIKELTYRKELRASWNKLTTADDNNDFITAADKIYTLVRQHKKTPKEKLTQSKKKDARLNKKANKSQGKLKSQESRFKDKKYAKPNKNKKFKPFKNHKANNAVNSAARIFSKFTSKKFLFVFMPILLVIFLFIFQFQACSAIFSNSGFLIGTFPANDIDIAKAEKYYTKLAWDYNERVIKVGLRSNWKLALKEFGVNTSNYDDIPDQFIFGKSTVLPYDCNYDYDSYTLIAFISAYFYRYNSEEEDIECWTYNSSVENALKRLFNKQYEFKHHYDNTSHWQEKYNYRFEGGGGASDGNYYTIYGNDLYRDKMKAANVPGAIRQYCDDEGFIHYNSNLEILNAQKNNKRTGWFIQDQRYIVTDPSGRSNKPFYYYNNGEFCWMFRGHEMVRNSFGWSDAEQAWWVVSPTDSYLWNGANYHDRKCLVSFYQKNEWVTDCRLYYTVRQVMTLDEAAKSLLSNLSNSQDRLNYYNALLRGDGNNCIYGGHQLLNSPITSGFNELIDNKRYYNQFGWDVQAWNKKHCSCKLENCVDIDLAPGCDVFSMIDGKIIENDRSKYKIVIESTVPVEFWNSEKYKLRVTYYNANLTSSLNQAVKAGEKIGRSTSSKYCSGNKNTDADRSFLCVKIEIYDNAQWNAVDPQLLINFSDLN